MKYLLGLTVLIVVLCSVSSWRIFPLKDQVVTKPAPSFKQTVVTTKAPTQTPTAYDLVSGSYGNNVKPTVSGRIPVPSKDLLPPKEDVTTTPKSKVNITPKPFHLTPTIVSRNNFKGVTVVPGISPTAVLRPGCFTTIPGVPGQPTPSQNLDCDTTSGKETPTLNIQSPQDLSITEEAINTTISIGLEESSGQNSSKIVTTKTGGKRDNELPKTEKKPPKFSPPLPLAAEEDPAQTEDDDSFFEQLFAQVAEEEKKKQNPNSPVNEDNDDDDGKFEYFDPDSFTDSRVMEQPLISTVTSTQATNLMDAKDVNSFLSLLFNTTQSSDETGTKDEPTFGAAVEPVGDESPQAIPGPVEQPALIPTNPATNVMPGMKEETLNDAKDVDSFIDLLFQGKKPAQSPTTVTPPIDKGDIPDLPTGGNGEMVAPSVPSPTQSHGILQENLMNATDLNSFISILFNETTRNEKMDLETTTSFTSGPIIVDQTTTTKLPKSPEQILEEDKVLNAPDVESLIGLLFDEKEFPREVTKQTPSVATEATLVNNASVLPVPPILDDDEVNFDGIGTISLDGDLFADEEPSNTTKIIPETVPQGLNKTMVDRNPASVSILQNRTILFDSSTNASKNVVGVENIGSSQFMTSKPNVINIGNIPNPQQFNNNLTFLPPKGYKTTHFINIIQHVSSHSTPNNTNTNISTNYSSKVVTESDDREQLDTPSVGAVNQVSYGGSDIDIPGIDQLPLEESSVPAYPTPTPSASVEANSKKIKTPTDIETPNDSSRVVSYGPFTLSIPAIDILPLQDTKINPYQNNASSYHTSVGSTGVKVSNIKMEPSQTSDVREVSELILDLAPPKDSKDIVTLEVIPAHVINVKTTSQNGKIEKLSVVLLPPKVSYFTKTYK